ncbi:N-acetylmuramoyl-L-alanine amidase CwlD [Bacillaceae bacterium W0354]
MKRLFFILVWIAGLILLVYLLRIPLPTIFQPTNVTMPLANQVIVIDPGHGGVDGGAQNKDIKEKSITLKTAFYLRDYLQQAGAMVYLTREKDMDLAPEGMKGFSKRKAHDIRRRVSFIKEKDADLFVSIHLNSLSDSRWKGAQTFFYPNEKNEKLARSIQERMRNISNTKREALATNNVYILKHAEATGALVELGFLSNEEDRNKLLKEDYQREMAAGIYQGIVEYITSENTP